MYVLSLSYTDLNSTRTVHYSVCCKEYREFNYKFENGRSFLIEDFDFDFENNMLKH